MSRTTRVDVIVAGGGMAGAVTALALARTGLATTVVDPRRAVFPGEQPAMRVSSIHHASEDALRRLGAWSRIAAGRTAPFDRIEVRDAGHDQVLVFDAADAGLGHLAHILENDLVVASVHEALANCDGFVESPPGRIVDSRRDGGQVAVTCSDGTHLRGRLLVAADGAGSALRRQAGIPRQVFDYRQQALVARVVTRPGHGGTARQIFLPGGPLAFLPLADDSCSIVWSLPADEAVAMQALSDGDFLARLESACHGHMGELLSSGRRLAFPLRRSHARRYHAERLVLVGDAGHTVHPLAGLGANQGIADALALAAVLAEARERDQDIGGERVLSAYQRRRRPHNAAALAAMDLFHFGFANDSAALGALRGRVLARVAASPAARRLFVRQACGLAPGSIVG